MKKEQIVSALKDCLIKNKVDKIIFSKSEDKTIKKAHGKLIKLKSGMHSAQAAAISMAELLQKGAYKNDKVIFCGSVDITIGASLALREAGKKIPEDVSLVSFGNPELAALQNPPLTVISTPDPYSQVEEIMKQYLGISDDPERLKFTGTIPHDDEESIIFKGKSVKFNHN